MYDVAVLISMDTDPSQEDLRLKFEGHFLLEHALFQKQLLWLRTTIIYVLMMAML